MSRKAFFKSLVTLVFALVAIFAFTTTAFGAYSKPGKVEGLTQTSTSSSSVKIAWDSNLAKGYEVSYSTDGTNFTVYEPGTSFTDTYISGLSAGKSYYVRVRAYNAEYVSSSSKTFGAYSDVLEVVTEPDGTTSVTQSTATEKTATITWTAVNGATGYVIKTGGNEIAKVNTNKYTISKVDKYATYYVYSIRESATGYVAEGGYKGVYSLKLIPAAPKSLSFNYLDWLEWKSVENAEGYQIELYKAGSKKVYKKLTSGSDWISLSKYLNTKQFYKARVRASATINGSKKWGKWSKNYYFMGQLKVNLKKATSSKLNISWKKVKGVKNYTIYVSTSRDSGYKKVATVSAKKTSYNLTKFKGKTVNFNSNTYYVTVVANGKFEGKKYTSIAADAYYLY